MIFDANGCAPRGCEYGSTLARPRVPRGINKTSFQKFKNSNLTTVMLLLARGKKQEVVKEEVSFREPTSFEHK